MNLSMSEVVSSFTGWPLMLIGLYNEKSLPQPVDGGQEYQKKVELLPGNSYGRRDCHACAP
jgi:hypothetical protein